MAAAEEARVGTDIDEEEAAVVSTFTIGTVSAASSSASSKAQHVMRPSAEKYALRDHRAPHSRPAESPRRPPPHAAMIERT